MTVDIMETAIVAYLKKKNALYLGKIQELRGSVQGWLGFIPQTFPHYTRHTIEHSEEIILQLSKMLFVDEDMERPVVQLSAVEAYILIASAYLHDAGMVASDDEKKEILVSEAWTQWTEEAGGGARRWANIKAFREGSTPGDTATRHFLADVQVRHLIAEFIRRQHHLRVVEVIGQHHDTLGRFGCGDVQLKEAISSVCLGHGLHLHELQDARRYPERRDIRGEPVNLRFMAILLRLGDLLDMSCDRACPLLANAASPIPSESYAHWSQYRAITHRLTAPDQIEISAECESQEVHRVIQDWCQWLVDEIKNARSVMSRAARHGSWKPPHVSMSAPDPTIQIMPSVDAQYIPSKWTLEFDRDAILERMIYHVHDDSVAFVLELIQNALDATRSKMYRDLVAEGLEPPDYPTQVPEEFRRRYPVHISLGERGVQNDLSGEVEVKQVLVIEDSGTGMNRNIIERFFLQIGRSYYTTEEYRRTCKFHPISRFGIGFLSVFAVSDLVVVETFMPEASDEPGAIRITLTGASNYLLSERGTRRTSGTRIEVLLRERMEEGRLETLVKNWCRRVEFPIIVDELGNIVTVETERPDQFVYEIPDVTVENARFVLRSFEINRPPIEGHLFVCAHESEEGERWDRFGWAQRDYPLKHPDAYAPPVVRSSFCFHGIERGGGYWRQGGQGNATRVDYRGIRRSESMSRQMSTFGGSRSPLDAKSMMEITARWEEILSEHLAEAPMARGESAWRYKQKLVSIFPFVSFWQKCPGTIQLYRNGRKELCDLQAVSEFEDLRVVISQIGDGYRRYCTGARKCDIAVPVNTKVPTMDVSDLNCLSEEHRRSIFRGRSVTSITRSPEGTVEIHWHKSDGGSGLSIGVDEERPIDIAEFPEDDVIGVKVHMTTGRTYEHCVLNAKHPFVQWMLRVRESARSGHDSVEERRYAVLMSLLMNPLSYGGYEVGKLASYVNQWKDIPGLARDLYPPDIEISNSMFQYPSPVTESSLSPEDSSIFGRKASG